MRAHALRRVNGVLAIALITSLLGAHAGAAVPSRIDYARDIRPLLSQHCFRCHGPDDASREAELRLDDRMSAIRELPTGNRAVVPGHPGDSALIARVSSENEEFAMPPRGVGGKLSEREIETLRVWIEQAAPYSRHWSYVNPIRPPLPGVSDPDWSQNAIDRFLLARLDQEGLHPSPPAERQALLRRVAIDLTGLPPTLDDVEALIQDTDPGAYERAVDRLLAKPSYGERWAAVWLDLARYGDSQGYIHDPPRTIWRWRDWLIQALNDNMPFDQLTIALLAGDLLPDATTGQLIATGFHRNTPNNTEGGANPEEFRHAAVVDRVNTTLEVWMGTTFGCAQCHNHKYDPFSQQEYYQVFAIFNGTEDNNGEPPALDVPRVGRETEFARLQPRLAEARAQRDAVIKQLDDEREAWEKSVDRTMLPAEIAEIVALPPEQRGLEKNARLTSYYRALAEEWTRAQQEVKAVQAEYDTVGTTTLVMKEVNPRPTYVALRGTYSNKGARVSPGVPAALHPAPEGMPLDRLALARWIVDPENPLTARVAVNRLWQEVFGTGLVETSEEFGNQGEPPSHPELLDWLATEYVRLGWDTKQLLKRMVTSATYCQSSRVDDELEARDPRNRLLARGPRVRLTAEAVRDQALFVSGLLSAKMYGPPVHPPQPISGLTAAFSTTTDWETSSGEDCHRRALYTLWRRNSPYPSLTAFDAPDRSACSLRRIRTNTPLQALVTLNDPVFLEAAQGLARRILREGGSSLPSRADYGFRLAVIRPPTARETGRLVALYESVRASLASDASRAESLATQPIGPAPDGIDVLDAAAWTVVGNVLLNLDEFLAKR